MKAQSLWRAKAALAAKIDGRQVDLAHTLDEDVSLEVLTFTQPEGREIFWHSSTHLMAQAIKELFPDTQLTIGPPIEEGFYYDFDKSEPFTAEDLEKIETRMTELANADLLVHRREVSREEAVALFSGLNENYKLEMIVS